MNLLEIVNFFKYNSRLKQNISYQSLGFIVKIITQLFYPVLMIITWGADTFGVWIIISTIVATIYGINFNFAEVARLEMTTAFTNKKNEKLNKLYSTTYYVQSINIIIFTILIFIITIFFLDLTKFKNESLNLSSLQYSYIFIVIAYYLELITYYFYPSLNYKGYTKIWVNQNSLYQVYSKILILTAFFLKDFLYLGLLFLLSNLIRLVLIYYFHNKYKQNLNFNKKYFDKILVKELLLKSLSYSLEKLNYLIRQNGLILIIGKFFSPTVVTLVNTARTLFYFLPINFFDVLIHASIIEFSKLKRKNLVKNILILHNKFLYIITIMALIYLVISNLFGKFIYELWIDDVSININHFLILFISVDAVIISFLNLLTSPFKSFNNFLFLSKIDFIFTVCSLFIALVLGYYQSNINEILFLILVIHSLLFLFIKIKLKSFLNKI